MEGDARDWREVTPTIRQNPTRGFEGHFTMTRHTEHQWLGQRGGLPSYPAQFQWPETAAESQLCQVAIRVPLHWAVE